jgi:hypothetical protein
MPSSSDLLKNLFKDKKDINKGVKVAYKDLFEVLKNSPTISMEGISEEVKIIKEESEKLEASRTESSEQISKNSTLEVEEISTNNENIKENNDIEKE